MKDFTSIISSCKAGVINVTEANRLINEHSTDSRKLLIKFLQWYDYEKKIDQAEIETNVDLFLNPKDFRSV